MTFRLDLPCTQEAFGALVGIGQPRVAQLVADGTLPRDGSAALWMLAYCERLREQAAGRGQELTIERAALARAQRIGQELKNAVAQREFAPVGLLADVLAAMLAELADEMEAWPAAVKRECAAFDQEMVDHLVRSIAAWRNRVTRRLGDGAARLLDDLTEEAPAEELQLLDDDPSTLPDDPAPEPGEPLPESVPAVPR
ncbi:MAG: hypothetical protein Q7U73_04985 [Rubrivivax sp.]|nr:hypothetical protein [Rubrivivax sp.]